jgi:hypothetical protein
MFVQAVATWETGVSNSLLNVGKNVVFGGAANTGDAALNVINDRAVMFASNLLILMVLLLGLIMNLLVLLIPKPFSGCTS